MSARFFDGLRQGVARFVAGVHELGSVPKKSALAQARERLGHWPPGVESFYQSFDGARLFTDSFVLLPLADLMYVDGALRLGTALELELRVDERGRIHEIDQSGDAIVVGSTVERWLDALLAREKLVVDREGEFKDVFSDDGEELLPEVRRKRARAGRKADPESAQFLFEEAELALEEGELEMAKEQLEGVIALDGEAPEPRTVLAGLLVEAGELAAAEAHYLAAAEASAKTSGGSEVRARRYAQAAELAARRGDDAARRSAAEKAVASDGEAAVKWLAEAEAAFAENEFDLAAHLVGLSLAVAASVPAEALRKKLAVRRSLRVV